MSKYAWLLAFPLLLSGCGAMRQNTAVAPIGAQVVHADGLLGGYSGRVGQRDGKLVLQLVHQRLMSAPTTFEEINPKLPGLDARTPVFLGQDGKLYGAWAERYFVLGSYKGNPAPGQALRYQWDAGSRAVFVAGPLSLTVLEFARAPQPEAQAPALL
jgi:hypothetical protein